MSSSVNNTPGKNQQAKAGGTAKTVGASVAKPGKPAEADKLDGLSPDEIADRILGIVDQNQDDDNFDLDASKFWYQAAYKDELEGIFKERNRLRILIDQLKKRGFSENEIYELYSRVRRAKLSSEKAEIEAEQKAEKLKKKLINIGVVLVTLFIVGQMFFKSNQFAIERENERIAEVKTLLCEIDKPPLLLKTDFEAQWGEVVGFKTGLREGMYVKTTTGAHKIRIAENAVVVFDADAVFKIDKVTLDAALKRIAAVDISLQQGVMSWNLSEDSGVKLNFKTIGTALAVSYGIGKIDLSRNPNRVAIKEGETSIQVGRALSRSLNGLMEAILSEPPEFKIYDNY
ncbi:MAG: hypothetical protein GX569_00380 [Candidatus Riflebacteria bacterium]|nr:hypothetical protein [Candidatus Riflebacteria bacterium]